MGRGMGQQSAWGWAGSPLGQSRGLARGAEKQGEPCGEGFWSQAGEGGSESLGGQPWGASGSSGTPAAPFLSHKAGFVSIYLLDFSAKMLLEKHIALI